MTINRHQADGGSNQRLEPERARNQSPITQKSRPVRVRSASLSSLNLATNHAELCSGGDEVDAVPFSSPFAPSAPSASEMGKISAAEKEIYNPLEVDTLLDVLGNNVSPKKKRRSPPVSVLVAAPSAPSESEIGKISAAERGLYKPLSMQALLDVFGDGEFSKQGGFTPPSPSSLPSPSFSLPSSSPRAFVPPEEEMSKIPATEKRAYNRYSKSVILDISGDDGYYHKQDDCQSEQGKSRSNSTVASSLPEKPCNDSDGEDSACGTRTSSPLSQAKNKWPDHILQSYPRIVEYLSESDSGNTIIMAYSENEFAMSESPPPSDYAEEAEEDPLYVASSDEVRSSKKGKNASNKSSSDNCGRKLHKKKRRPDSRDKKAGKSQHNAGYESDSTDDGAKHKHRKCTNKKKHLSKQKTQHSSPALPSSDNPSSDDGSDDQAPLLPSSKNKLSFLKKETVKLKGSGNVKYSKLENCTSSSSSCSGDSDSDESDANAASDNTNAAPSWQKKAAVFLGGLAIGAGGVIATMRGGGAAAAAVGGLLGISFATNSESKIEGNDNTVVGGGSNGLFSYNYIWKPPQPGLIRSLHETNREECMRMGMVYKDPTDSSLYGWNTQHDSPSCLMNVPKEMVQGFCRTLLVEEPKAEEQSNQDQAKKATGKTQAKRDTGETQELLDKMRGKDANEEDRNEGKEWLKKSNKRR